MEIAELKKHMREALLPDMTEALNQKVSEVMEPQADNLEKVREETRALTGLLREQYNRGTLNQPFKAISSDAEEYINQQLFQARVAQSVAEIRQDPGNHPLRRTLLKTELLPYQLDGIAFAVGAGRGYFYIRAEYPLAIQRINAAIDICRQQGIIGTDMMQSGQSFDMEVVSGAGAFVAGEETALLAAIEGRRAVPRYRPPYPSERGLWGQPTLVNNVETLASVPWIIRNGAAAFAV